jgi:predicted ATPase/class 3 adenylate cyclase
LSDVTRWLDDLGLTKYAQTFADNEIDFEVLSDLTNEDLKGLGIPFGPRKKLCKAILALGGRLPVRQVQDTSSEYPAEEHFGHAERRHLTVMFCDLVGSTPLAEGLDPEDYGEIIRNYQNACSEVIERYEGYVARYAGDGILAYFGFPHAHEDEAARAVWTALDIVKAVGALDTGQEQPLRVRIGIGTGLVVVGDVIGSGPSREQAVVGEMPNIAARLHDLAEPDSILITAGTRRLLGEQFEYEDLGARQLKGVSERIRVWRVKGARVVESRFDATHHGALSILVGREPELELMVARWRRAAACEGQMVLLAGEAGVGKSRVVEALHERLVNESHFRVVYQCSPHHVNSPLYPAINQLEFAAGLAAGQTPKEKAERLTSLMRQRSMHDDDVRMLLALLSIPLDPPLDMTPEEQKQKTLRALSAMLEAFAEQGPVLWVVEDAHWSDPTTRELIGLVSDRASQRRLLIVVTHRPELVPPWLGLGCCTMLTLNRLGRDACATLLTALTHGTDLPQEVSAQIISTTDGVPLFVEELTRAVLESGLLTKRDDRYVLDGPLLPLAIPSTLQDSLMARLDRMEGVKETGQIASAIGREFPYTLLEAVSPLSGRDLDQALSRLSESGIVFQRGTPPDASYVFKHTLVQNAAYESLLRSERQLLHTRIARTLEERYPERVDVEPEILAHHYTHAGFAEQAVAYWVLASRRALDRSANLEVIGYVTRALELIDAIADTDTRERQELNLQVVRGAAYRAAKGFASSEAERSFTRARELCERLGDTARLIDVLRGLYSCYYARGELGTARKLGERVLSLGQETDDADSCMLGHWMLGCIQFWQGEFSDTRHHLEQASSLYDHSGQRVKTLALQIDPGVNALFHLGWTLWILGYPEQAVSTSDRAITIARELSQPFALSMALFFACETRACFGHDAGTQALREELHALCAKYGLEYMSSCANVLEGQALIANNDNPAGLQRIDQAFDEFQRQEAGVGLPWAMSIAATAYRQLGKREEGLATIARAFAVVEKNGERQWEAELHRIKGELLLMEPGEDAGEAERCFQRAADLARRQNAKSLELRAAMSLARLEMRHGKESAAGRRLAEVYARFSEGRASTDLKEAAGLLEACGRERGA